MNIFQTLFSRLSANQLTLDREDRVRRQVLRWTLAAAIPATGFHAWVQSNPLGWQPLIWSFHAVLWVLWLLNETKAYAWAPRLAVLAFFLTPLGMLAIGSEQALKWQAPSVVFAGLLMGWRWGGALLSGNLAVLMVMHPPWIQGWLPFTEHCLFLGTLFLFAVLTEQAIRNDRRRLRRHRAELESQIELNQRQQAQITRTRTWFEQTQQIAHLGLMDLDLESETLLWSDQFYRLLDLEPGEAEPDLALFYRAIPPEDRPRIEQALNDLIIGTRLRFRLTHQLKRQDGHFVVVEQQGQIATLEGKPRLLVSLYDLTELHSTQNQIRQALAESDLAHRAKSAFLANMSHELRTPLNGILGMLQLAQLQAVNAEQAEELDTAEQSAQNLLRLLNSILEFSEIESGQTSLKAQPFNLATELNLLIDLMQPIFRQQDQEFTCQLGPDLDQEFIGDARHLKQILSNLLHNAHKFGQKKPVRFEAQWIAPPHNALSIVVADQGPGFDRNRLKDYLEPFGQGESGYVRQYDGVGLGLSLVKKLVDLMEGEIHFHTAPGAGCRVELRLPLARTAKLNPTAIAHPSGRVLLVEDNRLNRKLSQKVLEQQGLSVETAANGEEALDFLSSQRVDFVLMDLNMPVMDGLLATRLIRAGQTLDPKVPVYGLIGRNNEQNQQESARAGMDGFLNKPLESAPLVQLVARYCA
ncbi:MAG: response regulator [bacterium]|nr:response regulator [bacterium]